MPLRTRTLLLLGSGFLLTALMIWAFSTDPEDATPAHLPAAAVQEQDHPAAPLTPAPSLGTDRTELDRTQDTAQQSQTEVFLHAEVSTVMDEAGFPPEDCEGWVVTVQTRDRTKEEIQQFQATCDAEGVARFGFHGPTHVDWVRCIPPGKDSRSMGYWEGHTDLTAGDVLEVVLNIQPGHSAKGLVVDGNGQPVADLLVQTYADIILQDSEILPTPILSTKTDAKGVFRVSNLPTGFWKFAVDSPHWEMIKPTHGGQRNGRGGVGINEDTVLADAGTLHVTATSPVELRILTSEGQPAGRIHLVLKPLSFDSDFMVPQLSPKSQPGSGAEPLRYPKPMLYIETDEAGAVSLSLPRGQWSLRGNRLPGAFQYTPELELGEFHTDERVITRRLSPIFLPMRGRIITSAGIPLKTHTLRLYTQRDGHSSHYREDQTDDQGRFYFPLVKRGESYSIWVPDGPNTLLNRWPIPKDWDQRELELVVPEQENLQVRFLDLEGKPHEKFIGLPRLISWDSSPNGDPDPKEGWWEFAKRRKYAIDSNGMLRLYDLRPGTYTIGLFSAHSVEKEGAEGPLDFDLELSEMGRFQVRTGVEDQEIRIGSSH